MDEGAENDPEFQGKIPVFEIFDVASDAIFDIGIVPGFATESADLSETGDARFNESADVIVRHQLREVLVMLD